MYNNWASDQEVTKYLTWPHHETPDTTKSILQDWISQYDKKDFYLWAIELKSIQQPIGSISVVACNDDTSMVEIGYCIGRNWWHAGITR